MSVDVVLSMGYYAHKEVASQQAYSIPCSGECFRDLLSLAELRVVTGGLGWLPSLPIPTSVTPKHFVVGQLLAR